MNVRDQYWNAVLLTTQEEADAFFIGRVQEVMAWAFPVVSIGREEAERIVRQDLYWTAILFTEEIQARVKMLYKL